MRKVLLCMTVLVLAFAGCKKYDLDITALNDNPFDPDGVGPRLFTVDSIRTVELVSGAIYQQRIHLSLDPALTAKNDWVIRYRESTVPDTFNVGPSAVQQGRITINNQQVQLGTNYCFTLDLLIGIPVDSQRIDTCAVAQL